MLSILHAASESSWGARVTKQPSSDRTIQFLLGALLVTQGGDTIMRRAQPQGARFQEELLDEMRDISKTLRETNEKLSLVVDKLDDHDRHMVQNFKAGR